MGSSLYSNTLPQHFPGVNLFSPLFLTPSRVARETENPMITLNQHQDVEQLLRQSKTIAIVGLSPKENRPSNMVGRYLLSAGYTIYPVNPGHAEILGQPCYPNLSAIPDKIDIVDLFRRSEEVLPFVEEAVRIGAKAVWMQLGIVNQQAAQYARDNGLAVIMDRCIKVDHSNLM